MAVLPDEPNWADLETAYLVRGRQLVECDMARRLAVEAFEVLSGAANPG